MLCPFGAEELFTTCDYERSSSSEEGLSVDYARLYAYAGMHLPHSIHSGNRWMAEAERRLAGTEASGLP